MSTAATLKKIRHKLLLEQNELADKLEISQSSICLYEQGNRIPRIGTVRKIIEFAKKHKINLKLEDFLE